MPGPDPHDVLGISPGAGGDEIRAAYRRLALRWHPDVNREPGADERFRAIRRAYEALTDPNAPGTGPASSPTGISMEAEDLGDAFDAFFGPVRQSGGRVDSGDPPRP